MPKNITITPPINQIETINDDHPSIPTLKKNFLKKIQKIKRKDKKEIKKPI